MLVAQAVTLANAHHPICLHKYSGTWIEHHFFVLSQQMLLAGLVYHQTAGLAHLCKREISLCFRCTHARSSHAYRYATR